MNPSVTENAVTGAPHALTVMRGSLLQGQGPAALAPSLQALAAFAVGMGGLGLALFAVALRRARVDGSLTHY